MKRNILRGLAFGVLFFAFSFSVGQAKTITMDGEFDDWDDVDLLISDSITGYPYSGTIYYFNNATDSWQTNAIAGACMYTADRSLDLGELKLANDDNYLYILWARGSDFLNYYWRNGDATEESFFSNEAATDDNNNPCAGEIVTAPADFDHDLILSVDKDKDGNYDYYLSINVVFDSGAYEGYETAGFIFEDNGNGTFSAEEEILLSTFADHEYEVAPDVSAVNGKILQEVKMDIAEIFSKLELDWGASVNVRYEAHSAYSDQTDSAQYTFEGMTAETQKADIDSWDAYRQINNKGVSCPERLIVEIKGKHFDKSAKVEVGSQDAFSVKRKSSKKIVAKFCMDDLLDNQASRKRTISVTNPDAEEEKSSKKINLVNVDYGKFFADDFDSSTYEGVLNIQRALIALDFLDEKYDTGFFGPLTINAVKQFQAQHNLSQVGHVGPLTRAKLEDELK